MIAKISRGSGFRGVLDYVLKSDSKIIGGNMSGENARTLAKEFGITRKLREDVESPCYHVSLSLPEGEEVSPDEWVRIANKYLARLGVAPTDRQFVLVQHHDTTHCHVHLVTSRIGLDGKLWKPEYDRPRSKEICRELEKEHNLTIVPNEKQSYGRAKTTQKERQMNRRENRDSEKAFVSSTIKHVLESHQGPMPIQAFCEILQAQGVVAIPAVASTGRMNGFSFQHGSRSYTGAQCGYGWRFLQPSLSITDNDKTFLQARKQALQQGTAVDALRSIKSAVWETAVRGVAFEKALSAQGWTLANGSMTKNGRSFRLDEMVNVNVLNDHIQQLQAVSKETREQAQARCRELARQGQWRPRQAFMREAGQEDVLLTMMLFPQLAVFLLVLGALVVIARQMGEDRLKAQMGEAWKTAQAQVNTAIADAQKELVSNERPTGSHSGNQLVADNTERKPREESADSRRNDGSVGAVTDGATGRDTESFAGDASSRSPSSVETENGSLGDGRRIFERDGVVVAGAGPSGVESNPIQTSPAIGEVADEVTEWLSLAQDVSTLAGGTSKMAIEAKAVREDFWTEQDEIFNDEAGIVRYSIVCVPRGEGDRAPWLPGRHGDVETFFDADGVKSLIPELMKKNAMGYDIFIRPRTGRYMYAMVDDLTKDAVDRMKADGYCPSMVLETSKGNHQAIFKIVRTPARFVGDPMREAEEEAGKALVRELSAQYGGDLANTGTKKGFRLAGFSNKKPEKHDFFTGIVGKSPVPCPKIAEIFRGHVDALMAEATQEAVQRRQVVLELIAKGHPFKEIVTTNNEEIQRGVVFRREREFFLPAEGETVLSEEAVKTFSRLLRKAEGLAKAKGWKMDQSAMDFRASVDMLLDRWDEPTVAECLKNLSPALVERHKDYRDYIRRTVSSAQAGAEKERIRRKEMEAKRRRENEIRR